MGMFEAVANLKNHLCRQIYYIQEAGIKNIQYRGLAFSCNMEDKKNQFMPNTFLAIFPFLTC